MANKPVINIVTTCCQPVDEDKFNNWYNQVHIPMLLKFKKLQGVARYKVVESDTKSPKYIALYKFASQKDLAAFVSSPELAAGVKEMQETWGKKIEVISRVQYELIKEWSQI